MVIRGGGVILGERESSLLIIYNKYSGALVLEPRMGSFSHRDDNEQTLLLADGSSRDACAAFVGTKKEPSHQRWLGVHGSYSRGRGQSRPGQSDLLRCLGTGVGDLNLPFGVILVSFLM